VTGDARRGTPPRVFLSKSAQSIENKGCERRKKLQESSRVRNRKEVKEIREATEVKDKISVRFVGDVGEGIGVRRWVRGRWAQREILSLWF
jgi:hypothetical protein